MRSRGRGRTGRRLTPPDTREAVLHDYPHRLSETQRPAVESHPAANRDQVQALGGRASRRGGQDHDPGGGPRRRGARGLRGRGFRTRHHAPPSNWGDGRASESGTLQRHPGAAGREHRRPHASLCPGRIESGQHPTDAYVSRAARTRRPDPPFVGRRPPAPGGRGGPAAQPATARGRHRETARLDDIVRQKDPALKEPLAERPWRAATCMKRSPSSTRRVGSTKWRAAAQRIEGYRAGTTQKRTKAAR